MLRVLRIGIVFPLAAWNTCQRMTESSPDSLGLHSFAAQPIAPALRKRWRSTMTMGPVFLPTADPSASDLARWSHGMMTLASGKRAEGGGRVAMLFKIL